MQKRISNLPFHDTPEQAQKLDEVIGGLKGQEGAVMPALHQAQEIYGYVEKNTPVICYHLPGTEPEPMEEIPIELEPELVPAGTQPVTETGQPVMNPQPETVPQPEPDDGQ